MAGKFRQKLLLTLAPVSGSLLIRLLWATLRVDILGEDRIRQMWGEGRNAIFAAWHDQLLLMIMGYRGPGVRILISASKDGELIARTMRRLGHGTVRGSSSRGGRAAFREMIALTREPLDLAVTPDGPKGPRHLIKPGVVQLARLSGRPVIPAALVCSRGHRFASWDRFLLPYPFARAVLVLGEPLYFGEEESVDDCHERMQRSMEENEARARARLEEYGVSAV
jgi:lysophospholipid acyltransferase (LPLAT)-like uncharacterized protein